MKQLLLAMILTLSSAFICVADDTPETSKKSDKEITLNVTGMDCSSCAKSVAGTYTKLKGVADANADAEKGTIKIKYDSKIVSEAELLVALKEKPKYSVSKPESSK